MRVFRALILAVAAVSLAFAQGSGTAPAKAPAANTQLAGGIIDLNTASVEELQRIALQSRNNR